MNQKGLKKPKSPKKKVKPPTPPMEADTTLELKKRLKKRRERR